MERNEDGIWHFTPREESIIAVALGAEDHETRLEEESFAQAIIEVVFDWANRCSAGLPEAKSPDDEAFRFFRFAQKVDSWLHDVLDARWPIRAVENAERCLVEWGGENAAEDRIRIEALVEHLNEMQGRIDGRAFEQFAGPDRWNKPR